MKYIVLAWLANLEYLKEDGGINYEGSEYADSYFPTDGNGNPKLFDYISKEKLVQKKNVRISR